MVSMVPTARQLMVLATLLLVDSKRGTSCAFSFERVFGDLVSACWNNMSQIFNLVYYRIGLVG